MMAVRNARSAWLIRAVADWRRATLAGLTSAATMSCSLVRSMIASDCIPRSALMRTKLPIPIASSCHNGLKADVVSAGPLVHGIVGADGEHAALDELRSAL